MRNRFGTIGPGAGAPKAAIVALTAAVLTGPTPLSGQVPTPAAHFGFDPGTAGRLANWDDLTAYYERLAQTSDRVAVDTLGPTTMGRPFVMLTITSPAKPCAAGRAARRPAQASPTPAPCPPATISKRC